MLPPPVGAVLSPPPRTQAGKYYSVNFPLNEGIDDYSFEGIFKPVVNKVRLGLGWPRQRLSSVAVGWVGGWVGGAVLTHTGWV